MQDEPEPFEALGAPPIVSYASLGQALSPAVAASLSRHPDARPAFIGMHLLAHIEGAPLPDAPPLGAFSGDLRGEVRALESMLSDALNWVRGHGPRDSSVAMRLAVRLIDQLDDDRRVRAMRYSEPNAIWDRVASGDVVLVRASWLLRRAGFVPVGREGRQCAEAECVCWIPRHSPQPLPRRQELETAHPEAIMPLAELKVMHRSFHEIAREAQSTASTTTAAEAQRCAVDDGAEAMPVVTVSHCALSSACGGEQRATEVGARREAGPRATGVKRALRRGGVARMPMPTPATRARARVGS